MSAAGSRPLVGVTADVKLIDGLPFHAVGEKYLRALSEVAGVTPLPLPAFLEGAELDGLLARLHGVLFTGSESNVHPHRYDTAASADYEPFDTARDRLTLGLIDETLRRGLPLLAICRGFQELNVALGGTLHPAVHQLPDRFDHRAPASDDLDLRYGPRHSVVLNAGGAFAELAGTDRVEVNSLHRQSVLELAPRLRAEGRAEDGTIEAVSVIDASGFALGVQWHPEYRAADNPFSTRLFGAFGAATRRRQLGER